MESSVRISVIIVSWNGRTHLRECLSSLAGQTFKGFETILVDNGSCDGSVPWVRKTFPSVKVIALSENSGFCRANNLAYAVSRGEFIALLNNDTRADPDWLHTLCEGMKRDQRIGICASRIVLYDNPDLLDAAGDAYDFSGSGFRRGHGENKSSFPVSEEVFGACAAAALYRRSMLEEVGFFDEALFAVGEDIDLSFRSRLAGYRCLYVPEAIVYHKVSSTIGVRSDFQLFQSRRNVEYVYFKDMPLALIILTFPMHLVYNLLTFVQAIKQKKLGLFLRAKLDFLLHFREVYLKRRSVRMNRGISLCELLASFSKNSLWKRARFELIQKVLHS